MVQSMRREEVPGVMVLSNHYPNFMSTTGSSSASSQEADTTALGAFGLERGMDSILEKQLLEENQEIIALLVENLNKGNIKINYSLMRKFAGNISRILEWYQQWYQQAPPWTRTDSGTGSSNTGNLGSQSMLGCHPFL